MSTQSILTVVGTVVGSYFGYPQLGAALGSLVGAALTDQPGIQGPRLTNVRAPELQFGAKVPRVYGRVWRTLTPSWWAQVREVGTTTEQGKGGGPEVTTYAYFTDVHGILADGDNVVDWTRIEIDGRVVQTRLAESTGESVGSTLWQDYYDDVELFTGGATQAPWSVMEAVEGIGATSAYRDQCTIGFTNLACPGGRPPVIRVEIVTNAEVGDGLVFWLLNADDTPGVGTAEDTSSYNNPVDALTLTQETSGAYYGSTGWTNVNDNNQIQLNTDSISIPWNGAQDMTLEGRFFQAEDLGFTNEWLAAYVGIGRISCGISRSTSPAYTFLYLRLFNTTFTGPQIEEGYPVALGVYNHVELGYEGSTRTGTLYLNGVAVLTGTHEHPVPSVSAITQCQAMVTDVGEIGFAGNVSCDGVRMTRQVLRHSAGFTPPEEAPTDDYPGTITTAPEDLQDVLEAEMLLCTPLVAGDIDMSAAAGKEVLGVEMFGSAASACGPILEWYFLDQFCLDKITIVERGGASEQTIPFAWSGAGVGERSDPFAGLKRANDTELAAVTVLQYVNILADGETGSEEGARISSGSKIVTAQCNIYALPTQAKGRAQTFTRDARVASHTATIRLGSAHGARVQPASLLTLVDNKGLQYRTRVARMVWNRGVYECEVLLDDPSVLTPVGITSEDYTPAIEVPLPDTVQFLALDNPPLTGADSAGYLSLVKTSGSRGAAWFDSEDDFATFRAGPQLLNDATYGHVVSITGTPTGGGFFDEASVVRVNVGAGTLSSSTRAGLLANRATNAILVGVDGRLVAAQYRTATAISAGVYDLTGFLWGQRGTEQYIGDMVAGDRFALLGIAGTAHIPRTVASLGNAIDVKAVVIGRPITSSVAVDFAPNGESLTPRSPVQLRRVTDAATGDAAYSFNRRTRLDTRFGGPLGDACPLGEDSEAYRVRLYADGTYSSVVRDLGTVSSPGFAYTGAQRTTDYGSTTATAYFGITQVSASVGEGHPLLAAA